MNYMGWSRIQSLISAANENLRLDSGIRRDHTKYKKIANSLIEDLQYKKNK